MGPFMAVIPVVISAASAVAAGVAASNAADYQAQVAKNNANISEQKQKFLMEDYAQRQEAMAKGDRAKMGALEAQLSSSGLDVGSGSTKAVKASEADILGSSRMAHAKAFSEDWYSEKTKQISANAQAQLDKMEAENAQTTGYLKGAGSLMGGAETMRKDYGWFGG
jgi:activator of 2-hydroxyglutaryl-CoA dehydratase